MGSMTQLYDIGPGINDYSSLNFLVVEDDRDTAVVMKKLLEKKFHAHTETVENCNQARSKVNASHFDIVTLDYQLPDGNGLKLLREIREKRDAPHVLIVTGKGDEQIAANSLKFGASGYIIKDQEIASALPEAIKGVLDRIALNTARKQIDELTKEKEAILENMAEHVAYIDNDMKIRWANKAAGHSIGKSNAELIGRECYGIWHQRVEQCSNCPLKSTGEKGNPVGEEVTTSSGRSWYLKCSPIISKDGNPTGVIHVGLEITDWKRADEELKKSEQKYRTLFNSLQEGMLAVNESGNIILANQKITELLGYSARDLIGKPLSRLMNDESAKIFKRITARRHRGSTEQHRFELRRKDGSPIMENLAIAPLVNDRDELEGAVVNVIGTPAKLFKEEAGIEPAETYRRLFEDAPHANFSIGIDGIIKKANYMACELTGYEIGELVGKPFSIVFADTPPGKEEVHNILKAISKSRSTENVEIQIRKADGDIEWASLSVRPVMNEEWEVTDIQVAAFDITERKNTSEALKKTNEELEGYAHTVSHDLKGPLSATSLSLDLLQDTIEKVKDPILSSELKELTESMRANNNRSYQLVENLLSLAKAGQEPKNIISIEIKEVVDEVLREKKKELDHNRIEVRTENEYGHIHANPVQIYAIFSNIIGNSIKHNRNSKPVTEISYLGYDQRKGHTYLIKDNGDGINPEDLENIFQPFFKGTESNGTGIGLSTAQRIAEVYGGTISAYNDNGACFEITLKDYENQE